MADTITIRVEVNNDVKQEDKFGIEDVVKDAIESMGLGLEVISISVSIV